MITYKLATEYQQETLKKIIDWAGSAQLGDMDFFWLDKTKHVGLQAVWLADGQVAIRNINSGIETSWRCINSTRGLRWAYTTLCGGVVEE
jgi:hypothetical protein